MARVPSKAPLALPQRGRVESTPAYVAPVPLKLILGSLGEIGFGWSAGSMYTSG